MKEYKVVKVKKEFLEECELPMGEYLGDWCGYVITIRHNEEVYRLRTNVGIR